MSRERVLPVRLLALAILPGLILLLSTSGAWAVDNIELHFAVKPELAPTHLCVLTFAEPNLQDVSNLFQRVENRPYISLDPKQNYTINWTKSDLSALLPDERTLTRDNRREVISVSPPSDATDADNRCDQHRMGEPADCVPAFTAPSVESRGPKMVCTANGSITVEANRSRIAVVQLISGQRELAYLELAGNIARLIIGGRGRLNRHEPVAAMVSGGFYKPGIEKQRIADKIHLPLTPRCVRRALQLPIPGRSPSHHMTEESTMTLDVAFMGDAYCKKKLQIAQIDDLEYLIPTRAEGGRSRLTAALKHGDHIMADYVASWTTASPPAEIFLKPTKVGFTWIAPASYPCRAIACPNISVPRLGLVCNRPGPTEEGRCRYTCEAPNSDSRGFDFPAEVVFELPSLNDAWTEVLTHPDQELTGYASPATRHTIVHLAFCSWRCAADNADDWSECKSSCEDDNKKRQTQICDPKAAELGGLSSAIESRQADKVKKYSIGRQGDQIYFISIWDKHGNAYRLRPSQFEQNIVIQDAREGDTIPYCIKGDRRYFCGGAVIKKGQLTIPDPSKKARMFSVMPYAGAGIYHPWLTGDDGPARTGFLGQIGLGFHWHLRIGKCLRSAWYIPAALEVEPSFLLARQSYRPLDNPVGAAETENEREWYDRLGGSVFLYLYVTHNTHLGISPALGGGVGFPLMTKNSHYVGNVRGYWIPLALTIRYRVAQNLMIELASKWLAAERFYKYTAGDSHFAQTPERDYSTLHSLTMSVGLRWWIH